MATQHKAWMLYCAAMATLGSAAGCYAIYYQTEVGGELFLRRRVRSGHTGRGLELYRRHDLLALMAPAPLPPPAPLKPFVPMVGVANVPPAKVLVAISGSRGTRYLVLGLLTTRHDDLALQLMRMRGRDVALVLARLVVMTALG